MDPRTSVVADRLAGIDRVVAVTGSKGGIGKSVVATTLALALADRGARVGLFDLDFTSPTDHVILGADPGLPHEDHGIDPHAVHGVRLMSVAFFIGDAPLPLRGGDTTNALLELLAITRWGDLDVLLVDMPPGLGDTGLDVMRLVPRLEFLLVGTGSRVVIESVRRAASLLTELGVTMLGIVENMRRGDDPAVAVLAGEFMLPYLGAIPFDPGLEAAHGDVAALRTTAVFEAIRPLATMLTG